MEGDDGGGSLISPDGVAPNQIVGASASVITIKPGEDGRQKYDCWVSRRGRSYMRVQAGGGEPSKNTTQPCAKADACVHDDLRADKQRKGRGFQVGTWNVDS